ncbi:type II toxin-antitoxin system VapC family toxin [Brevundimonas sp.]|uniref:type II toxin-antitoxin system VapC family toxin n=1 Tax=Brevundimonas sp. TaxID=1871086 RepID=UPI002AB84BAB|nr:type II toxin-antitoxin system VapC family toxin [Brevundimonas sp.]MDZ4363629.1 type II toxin-antitoxin system VapC family toxin [Brevundimonas sp.]
MRIAVDTNVLLRFLLADDPLQHRVAVETLQGATTVITPLVALCEVAWVLNRTYQLPRAEIATMLRALTEIQSVEYDVPEVEAGLAMLDKGGDFADGVIARQGRVRRADVFVSFDRKAVRLLAESGEPARLAGTA